MSKLIVVEKCNISFGLKQDMSCIKKKVIFKHKRNGYLASL